MPYFFFRCCPSGVEELEGVPYSFSSSTRLNFAALIDGAGSGYIRRAARYIARILWSALCLDRRDVIEERGSRAEHQLAIFFRLKFFDF